MRIIFVKLIVSESTGGFLLVTSLKVVWKILNGCAEIIIRFNILIPRPPKSIMRKNLELGDGIVAFEYIQKLDSKQFSRFLIVCRKNWKLCTWINKLPVLAGRLFVNSAQHTNHSSIALFGNENPVVPRFRLVFCNRTCNMLRNQSFAISFQINMVYGSITTTTVSKFKYSRSF